jgi:hypothetical protein
LNGLQRFLSLRQRLRIHQRPSDPKILKPINWAK